MHRKTPHYFHPLNTDTAYGVSITYHKAVDNGRITVPAGYFVKLGRIVQPNDGDTEIRFKHQYLNGQSCGTGI